jgi:anti-sigma B factor antagonist
MTVLEREIGIEVEPDLDGRVVVLVHGGVDLPEVPALQEVFARLCASDCPDVVLDLTDVTFIGSSGLGAITAAHHDLADRNRTLLLRGASPAIRKAFEITHLDRVVSFEVAPDAP